MHKGFLQLSLYQANASDQSFGAANLALHDLDLMYIEEMCLCSNTPSICLPWPDPDQRYTSRGVPGRLQTSSLCWDDSAKLGSC